MCSSSEGSAAMRLRLSLPIGEGPSLFSAQHFKACRTERSLHDVFRHTYPGHLGFQNPLEDSQLCLGALRTQDPEPDDAVKFEPKISNLSHTPKSAAAANRS